MEPVNRFLFFGYTLWPLFLEQPPNVNGAPWAALDAVLATQGLSLLSIMSFKICVLVVNINEGAAKLHTIFFVNLPRFVLRKVSCICWRKNKNNLKRDNRETVEMIHFFFSLLAKSGLLRTCLSQSLEWRQILYSILTASLHVWQLVCRLSHFTLQTLFFSSGSYKLCQSSLVVSSYNNK